MARIFSLSIHADYRCGRSGACCTSGWPIPVERATYEHLSGMLARGDLTPPDPGSGAAGARRALFVAPAGAPAETPVLVAANDRLSTKAGATRSASKGLGACAFYEAAAGLCAIHRQAGPALLPIACRQFPRVALADARGLFVNLSHYCPTSARLLLREDVTLQVVEGPAAFPSGFQFDPLDARDALPPLLRPGVLMSLPAFDLWERRAVEMFAGAAQTAEQSLANLMSFTDAVRAWTPAAGDLERCVEDWRGGTGGAGEAGVAGFDTGRIARACAMVFDAIPPSLRPGDAVGPAASAFDRFVAPTWLAHAAAVRRYLAARLFGSWVAYQGGGLRTIVSSVDVALSVLKANAAVVAGNARRLLDQDLLLAAIRRTDEMLVHLAAPEKLARLLSAAEGNRDGHSTSFQYNLRYDR